MLMSLPCELTAYPKQYRLASHGQVVRIRHVPAREFPFRRLHRAAIPSKFAFPASEIYAITTPSHHPRHSLNKATISPLSTPLAAASHPR
ncbi:hypothetical protein CCHOA_00920 [Corynebacterium choanae]|uniref:Uncharacterized protein n=1 Tax=Corynebacterium choanae TaxID=1862358 RepID=A0A3G6J4G4_9CORY|nr:hypothetical protein CCHOA_00920 [Corynebacterium choanae]